MLTPFYVPWCSLLRHPSICQVELSDRFLFPLVRDEMCLLVFLRILPHSLDGSICRKKKKFSFKTSRTVFYGFHILE